MHSRHVGVALAIAISLALSSRAAAQNLTLRANYRVSTRTHSPSLGVGASLGTVADAGPLFAVFNVGGDYIRRRNLGPGTGILSVDATLAPRWDEVSFIPFLGASASANWSGGQQTEWAGARTGFDAVSGIVFELPPISSATWILEERFGRVRGREHMFTTRLGLVLPLGLPGSGAPAAPKPSLPPSSLFRHPGRRSVGMQVALPSRGNR